MGKNIPDTLFFKTAMIIKEHNWLTFLCAKHCSDHLSKLSPLLIDLLRNSSGPHSLWAVSQGLSSDSWPPGLYSGPKLQPLPPCERDPILNSEKHRWANSSAQRLKVTHHMSQLLAPGCGIISCFIFFLFICISWMYLVCNKRISVK